MKSDYPILSLCANLEVSPSGYYDWQRRRTTPGPRARQNQMLALQIEVIHAQSRATYGSPRIVDTLRKQGARHGRNRVAWSFRPQWMTQFSAPPANSLRSPRSEFRLQAVRLNRVNAELRTSSKNYAPVLPHCLQTIF